MNPSADPEVGKHYREQQISDLVVGVKSDRVSEDMFDMPPQRKHSQNQSSADSGLENEDVDFVRSGVVYDDTPKLSRITGYKSFSSEDADPVRQTSQLSGDYPGGLQDKSSSRRQSIPTSVPIMSPTQNNIQRQSLAPSSLRPPLDLKVKSLLRTNSNIDMDVNQKQLLMQTELMNSGITSAVNVNSQPKALPTVQSPGDAKYEYPSQVSDFIYLGGVSDARNRPRLTSLNIEYVQNLAPGTVPNFFASDFIYKTVYSERDGRHLLQWLDDAFQFLEIVREADGRVLVHDESGTGRSAAAVILYMCKTYNLSLFESYSLVKSKRRETKLNAMLLHQMGNWEVRTQGKSTLAGVVLVAKKKEQKDELTGVITLKQARLLADDYEQTVHELQHRLVNLEQQRRRDVMSNRVQIDQAFAQIAQLLKMSVTATSAVLENALVLPTMQIPYQRAWDQCKYNVRPHGTVVLSNAEVLPMPETIQLSNHAIQGEIQLMEGAVGAYKGTFYYIRGLASRGFILHLLPWQNSHDADNTPEPLFIPSEYRENEGKLKDFKEFLILNNIVNQKHWIALYSQILLIQNEHIKGKEMVQFLHKQYLEQCRRTQYVIHLFEATLSELEDDTGQSYLKLQMLEQQLNERQKEVNVQLDEKEDLLTVVKNAVNETHRLQAELTAVIVQNLGKERNTDRGEHTNLINSLHIERQHLQRRIGRNQHAVELVEEKQKLVDEERKVILYSNTASHNQLDSADLLSNLKAQEEHILQLTLLREALHQRVQALAQDAITWQRRVGKLERERVRREALLVQVMRILAYRAAVQSLGQITASSPVGLTQIEGQIPKVRVSLPGGDRVFVHEQARFLHASVVAEKNDEFSLILPAISAKSAHTVQDAAEWVPVQGLLSVFSSSNSPNQDDSDILSKLGVVLSPVQAQLQKWIHSADSQESNIKPSFHVLEEYKRVFRMYQLQYNQYISTTEHVKQLTSRLAMLEREVDKTELLDSKLRQEEEIRVLSEQLKASELVVFNLEKEMSTVKSTSEERITALQSKMMKVYEGGLGLKDEWSDRFHQQEDLIVEGQAKYKDLHQQHQNSLIMHEKEMEEAALLMQTITSRFNAEIEALEAEKLELASVHRKETAKTDADWRVAFDNLAAEHEGREMSLKEQVTEGQARMRSLETVAVSANAKLLAQRAKMDSLKRSRESAVAAVQTQQAHQYDLIQTSNNRESKLAAQLLARDSTKKSTASEREEQQEARAADLALKLEQSKAVAESLRRKEVKSDRTVDSLTLAKELSQSIRPWLGLSVHALRVGTKQVLVVSHVAEGSAAHSAGMFERDVLQVQGGKTLKSTSDLTAAAKPQVPGSSVPVVIQRGLVSLDGSLDESHSQHIFLNLDLLSKDYDFHLMRRVHKLACNDINEEYIDLYRPQDRSTKYTQDDFNFLVNLKSDYIGKKGAKATTTRNAGDTTDQTA